MDSNKPTDGLTEGVHRRGLLGGAALLGVFSLPGCLSSGEQSALLVPVGQSATMPFNSASLQQQGGWLSPATVELVPNRSRCEEDQDEYVLTLTISDGDGVVEYLKYVFPCSPESTGPAIEVDAGNEYRVLVNEYVGGDPVAEYRLYVGEIDWSREVNGGEAA